MYEYSFLILLLPLLTFIVLGLAGMKMSHKTAGLIGTLRIEDDMNKPLLRKDDFAHIRTPQRLEKKDMVLYFNTMV